MKRTLKNIFHTPRFVIGFIIIAAIILVSVIYPIVSPGNPMKNIGQGSFIAPGTYISSYDVATVPVYDSTGANTKIFELGEDAINNRLRVNMSVEDRETMIGWLTSLKESLGEGQLLAGENANATVTEEVTKIVDGVETTTQVEEEREVVLLENLTSSDADAEKLAELWIANYNDEVKVKGYSTNAQRRNIRQLNTRVSRMMSGGTITVSIGDLQPKELKNTDYIPLSKVANVINLPLGTDNFGRDVFRELIASTGTSLLIGLMAGVIATVIGLMIGLLAGYVGGILDDILMFIANLFTVIPSFILLILINYSLPASSRGAVLCAVVIGFTSWVWTARSVRSQVISLRNRDHVNLSKLSGHSLLRIVLTDILPYVASYVVMAFILQVSSGILAEAQLSMIGLGPEAGNTPTLGLMMNWATKFAAHTTGKWWAYFPAIAVIAFISFSLNLMNTGLDQVFNPTLRD